jgi:hypothetical protein
MFAASLPTLSWVDELFRLGLAALLGGIIGIERQFREREAGLRTHMLVAVGAALFTVVSARLDDGRHPVGCRGDRHGFRRRPLQRRDRHHRPRSRHALAASTRRPCRQRRRAVHRLDVNLPAGGGPRLVVEAVEQLGVRLESFEVSQDERTVEAKLHLPRGVTRPAVVQALATRDGIRGASWAD